MRGMKPEKQYGLRSVNLAGSFQRLDELEGKLCVPCNDMARIPVVRYYFAAVSRLGNGIAWYAMLAVLPLVFGLSAVVPTLHMGLTSLVVVALHRLLKQKLVRERPYSSHAGVRPVTTPLDRYSFPSGHTMHACAFIVMLGHYFPAVMWIMLPFAVSVALSRVILGLHYPSDVLAGAVVGWVLARSSLALLAFVGA